MPGEFGLSEIILMMVIICTIFMLALIFQNKLKHIFQIIAQAIAGGIGIILCNFLLSLVGASITVGLNFMTLLIIGLLGMPGFATVYFIGFLL